ncbi:MAG: hypothetical protein EU532_01630 [Promethearchaeota archaeon]|nr:MAG: hypothetical protein EU532_01630 [Candidatus Lokiarchaeota archaeon]
MDDYYSYALTDTSKQVPSIQTVESILRQISHPAQQGRYIQALVKEYLTLDKINPILEKSQRGEVLTLEERKLLDLDIYVKGGNVRGNTDGKESYSILDLFRDIKKDVSLIMGSNVNFRVLSINYLMKKSKWYVNDLILRSKRDPSYTLKISMLNAYERSLRQVLGNNIYQLKFKGFFDKYRCISSNGPTLIKHPNLISDYFQIIDTKDKAYWFGWLLAEATLSSRGNKLSISISIDDILLLKRFINDLDLNPKKYEFNRRFNNKTGKFYYSLRIKFSDNKIKRDLVKLGFPTGKKSHLIRFPSFSDPSLEMACLMGFFDGDGSHSTGSPIIYSKSEKFLRDVICKFEIVNEISLQERSLEDGRIEKYYSLNLGGSLFNKLLENIDGKSLPRKQRSYFERNGILFTRDELEKIIIDNPGISKREIAKLHIELKGQYISDKTIAKFIDKWNIDYLSLKEYRIKRIKALLLERLSLDHIYNDEFNCAWGKYRIKYFFADIFKGDPQIKADKDILKQITEIYGPKGNANLLG